MEISASDKETIHTPQKILMIGQELVPITD